MRQNRIKPVSPQFNPNEEGASKTRGSFKIGGGVQNGRQFKGFEKAIPNYQPGVDLIFKIKSEKVKPTPAPLQPLNYSPWNSLIFLKYSDLQEIAD